MFGGVYLWCATVLSMALAALALGTRPWLARNGMRTLDLGIAAALAGILLQLIPLPRAVTGLVSPARVAYARASTLQSGLPSFLPLSLDPAATLHAFLAAFCIAATFWTARTVFSRGGIRTVVTGVAWIAIVLVPVAFAQTASGTSLVYGFWSPYDAGARPLGPFVNRNHAGTWSLLALMLCFGHLQWRRASASPPPGAEWRVRTVQAVNGRTVILTLAILVLTLAVALGASRSTMLALACAAGYVALAAPRDGLARHGWWWTAALGLAALLAVIAFADVDRLISRLDETRQLGLAQRTAIWRDTAAVIRDFPLTGVGAGSFSRAMRLYQTSDRTYFWNEAHNEYLQVAAEGGLLLWLPLAAVLASLTAAARRALAREDDATLWMRIGAAAALVAVAVQACLETGLSLPANGMLAAVAAAILVHEMRPSTNAATGH
jgi:O-antigen ligase